MADIPDPRLYVPEDPRELSDLTAQPDQQKARRVRPCVVEEGCMRRADTRRGMGGRFPSPTCGDPRS
jgi:hypothetical protein